MPIPQLSAIPSLTAPTRDLPPAGPQTQLSPAQLAWLYEETVTDPRNRLWYGGVFQAVAIENSPEYETLTSHVSQDPALISAVLYSMHKSLALVSASKLPSEQRASLAYALNQRYDAFLERLSREESLPGAMRKSISRSREEFLVSTLTLEELFRQRQTLAKLLQLEKEVQAALTPASEASVSATPAHEEWRIEPPAPKSDRGEPQGKFVEYTNNLSSLARQENDLRFRFDALTVRSRIASDSARFSPRTTAAQARELETFARMALDRIRTMHASVIRIAHISLRKGFINPASLEKRGPRILHMPDNKNLRLHVHGSNILLHAHFETDIASDAALKAIKASIEDYWRGRFTNGSKSMRMRTQVRIRKLGPAERFSSGSLRLTAASGETAHAGADGIVFDHDLDYATPAHEFGHVLGLADEYREGYRAARKVAASIQFPSDLMSSLLGNVQERHLKTVYQLLLGRARRGRAAPSS